MSPTEEFEEKLKDAKRNLYALLLQKKITDLTENEIDLQYHLSKDHQIQELLKGKISYE